MSNERKPFLSLVQEGRAQPDDIDDFVNAWHANPGQAPLREFLGLSEEEYGLWVVSPEALAKILAQRKAKLTAATLQ